MTVDYELFCGSFTKCFTTRLMKQLNFLLQMQTILTSEQLRAASVKYHRLLFDGCDFTSCILHQTGIAAFAMGNSKTMTQFMNGNL